MSATSTAVPNLVQLQIRPGLLGEWVKCKEIFIYLFIYSFFGTHLQVRPVDRFSRLMAQTTRTRARTYLLGVSLTLLLILEVKYPQNPNFWGVNSQVVIVGGPNRAQQIHDGGRPPF